jgi:hypothetical protein
MDYVFEITDKSGRKIHLSKERWTHIRKKHPEIETYEIIKEGIGKFDKITSHDFDSSVHYYCKFYKHKKPSKRYLCVAIKYLNGEGYVITAYFDNKIR